MTRGIFTFLSFFSTIFFPWIFTVVLALVTSLLEPLIPLAIGLFADTLYYSPSAEIIPFFTLYGAIASIVASFVRSRLKTSIIME